MSYRNQCLVANPKHFGRAVRDIQRRVPMRGGSLLALVAAVTSCLSRPIADSEPVTTNVVIGQQTNDAVHSIDVLLMIDNSSSMADKQETLAVAVPQLLKQLVQPQCVDSEGKAFNPPIVAALGAEQPCSQGAPEFNPVNDIHVGVVTSSLGDHGEGARCTPGQPSGYADGSVTIPQAPDVNDKSYLIGSLDRGKLKLTSDQKANSTSFATVTEKGFLAWGSTSQASPSPNTPDLDAATAIFRDMVSATDEKGCGFEAQLESWFRFLIDPVPPVLPLASPVGNKTSRQGVDDDLLAQRAQFLRPDSLVAIVMLTDENDCSLRDTDYGWLGVRKDPIVTGSKPCATNPNDPCCYSCMSTGAPSGCAWTCPNPPNPDQPAGSNDNLGQANLRCWQQKQRFGVELTYPTSRYSVALTKKELCPDQTFGDMDCDCTYAKSIKADCDPGARRFPNPLYSNVIGRKNDGVTDVVSNSNAIPRQDNSAVFLAGIVGVPWQDISEPDSQAAGATLRYIPVTDKRWTASGGIWDQIVAEYNDDGSEKAPGDPRMIESIMPRDGLPAPTAAVSADPIIGHESNTAKKDLEYACIYRLPTPKPCDCEPDDLAGRCPYEKPNDCCELKYSINWAYEPGTGDYFKKPLCQDPANGSYDARTQYFAKGYPGLRELSVLHEYAEQGHVQGNSIVASICPKDLTSEPESSGYGYNPAVAALIERLKVTLKGSCLPRPLSVAPSGEVPCNVVEAVTPSILEGKDCNTYCQSQGRNRDVTSENPTGEPSSNIRAAVVESMQQTQLCDEPGSGLKCAEMCLCLLPQERRSSDKLKDPQYPSDLAVCQNADEHSVNLLDPGYCYVDPGLKDSSGNSIAGDNENLVSKCPSTQRRILRFVGNQPTAQGGVAVPLTGARVFSACQGSSVKSLNE
jgi:hypothetical protein